MTALRKVFIADPNTGVLASVESNKAQAVNIQDQHTRSLDLRFGRSVGVPTTLALDSVPDTNTITVADATGFVAGTFVGVVDPVGNSYFGVQLGDPAGNVLTLDTPMDLVYVAGATVLNLSFDMAVDGSITPITFQIGPVGAVIEIDITRLLGYIQSGSAQDDATFGGLPALTNGCVLRRADGTFQNLWNVKSNGDIALIGYDFLYTPAAPSGSFGARFRITYAGQNKHGVTIRLGEDEILEFIVQDNLTGLQVFNMMAQGHLVTD